MSSMRWKCLCHAEFDFPLTLNPYDVLMTGPDSAEAWRVIEDHLKQFKCHEAPIRISIGGVYGWLTDATITGKIITDENNPVAVMDDESGPKACTCDTAELLRNGCKCGGI
jgi:hypothetical protein